MDTLTTIAVCAIPPAFYAIAWLDYKVYMWLRSPRRVRGGAQAVKRRSALYGLPRVDVRPLEDK